jgi:hypothetical protein
MHIALLGDSILDNRSYTNGEPDVAGHLRGLLPDGARVTLCAVDGSLTADLSDQFENVPADASHIVVSIGGNDLLQNFDLVTEWASSGVAAFGVFRERLLAFELEYRKALRGVLSLQRPTAICTVYNGNLAPELAPIARGALTMFNDVILRCGFEYYLPIIDLRFICTEAEDYANPIEPSGSGGFKIAKAIAGWAGIGDRRKTASVHTS